MNTIAPDLTISPAIDAPVLAHLDGRVVARSKVSSGTTHAMFALLAAHFAGVDRSTFDADLAEKNWVILLEDEGQRLRGFSTLLIYRTRAAGPPVTVVYSGDTIVDRAWWGSPALPRTWVRAVRQMTPMEGSDDLYWLLLTSGYRTYRFLPVFFRSFYPRHDEETPPAAQAMLDDLAFERFGSQYDPPSGIVRFQRPQLLAPHLLEVPTGRAQDDHVRFFLTRNPGYVLGDELVCLTRIHDDNLSAAGRRMARSPLSAATR
jgi:hypothetical protein